MSKPTVPDLKELFKQASEIAQQVPESMQEAAFNRAVDLLTNDQQASSSSPKTPPNKKAVNKKSGLSNSNIEENSIDDLVNEIDSTQHPGITSTNSILNNALMVLHIVFKGHGIDGLSSSEIAKILTNTFRIPTQRVSVNSALNRALHLVNRISNAKGYSYRIMAPGEEYLAHLDDVAGSSTTPQKRPKTKKKLTPKKPSTASNNKPAKGKDKNLPTKKKSSLGPKAAILDLISSGFFSEVRMSPEIQEYLKKKRGYTIGKAQLSLAMLRMVRDEKLERDQNAEGQYEYKIPNA